MTIAEINALTISDVWEILLSRMLIPMTGPLDGDEYWWLDEDEQLPFFDRITVDTSLTKPTEQEMDDDLDAYKSELIVIENERLRRVDWRNRFKSISDLRMVSFDAGYTGVANLKVWARDSINANDETILLALEVQEPITTARLAQESSDDNQWHIDRDAAIIELKALDWSSVTTISKMRTVLKKTLKILLK